MAGFKKREDALYSYLKIKLPKHVVMNLGGVEVVEWMIRDYVKGNFLASNLKGQGNRPVSQSRWGGARAHVKKLGLKAHPVTVYNFTDDDIKELGSNEIYTGRAIIRKAIYTYTDALLNAAKQWRENNPGYIYNEDTIRAELKEQLLNQSKF